MKFTLLIGLSLLTSTNFAAAGDSDYLAAINEEAIKIPSAKAMNMHKMQMNLILAAPSASAQIGTKLKIFGQNPREKSLSISGLTEILRFKATGAYELFETLSLKSKREVLDAYNGGVDIKNLRPMISSLYIM